MDEESSNRWLNASNVVCGVFVIILLAIAGWFYLGDRQYNSQIGSLMSQSKYWQTKLDKKIAANSKVIYLPKANSLKLSSNQVTTIHYLNDFFNQMWMFQSNGDYAKNYKYAKSQLPTGLRTNVFKDLWISPKTFSNFNIMSRPVQTQILIMGKNRYRVVSTYIWYHDHSDMNNPQTLTTLTKIFEVDGTPHHFTKFDLNRDVNTRAINIPYSNFLND